MGTSASRLASVYGNRMVRVRSISSVVYRPSLARNPSPFSPFALYSTAIDRMSSEQSLLCQELVQEAVLLHPSFVTVDDIKGGKVSIAILGAVIDRLSPPALLKQFEEILASKPDVKPLLLL
ncbi:hypothetical protein Bca52824_071408 [Brassica carinata]|uniref:Uncharacterized protein n=1 Tax=Brassica carinata TaxID=52824 RepID=A0A8X7U3Y0_BRACI|nr:hypothetical protein Bca52824_071408 [Brassica carinata]